MFVEGAPLPDLAVVDMSFISLRLVLPPVKSFLQNKKKDALVLIKPQFEIGKGKVGKGGVVRGIKDHLDVLNSIIEFSINQGWKIKDVIPSPIKGAAGNQEYMLWISMTGQSSVPDLKKLVGDTLI